MKKAISPQECIVAQRNLVPDWVIDAFNSLIIQKWNGEISKIDEYDLSGYLDQQGVEFQTCEDKGMFKIESIYKETGWEVNRKLDLDTNDWYWEFRYKEC